jgi:hypothetical protein
MNNEYKGELRLVDGTPVGKVVDWSFDYTDNTPPPKFHDWTKPIEAKIEGTFTPGDGLSAFIEKVFSEEKRIEIMASVDSIPMDDFLSKYPQVIRDWIEKDLGWMVDEIEEILLDEKTIHVSVSKNIENGHETHEECFTSGNGKWRKTGQNVSIRARIPFKLE